VTVRQRQFQDLPSADERKKACRWSRRQHHRHTRVAHPSIFGGAFLFALSLCLQVTLAPTFVLLAATPRVAAQSVNWGGGGTLRIRGGQVPPVTGTVCGFVCPNCYRSVYFDESPDPEHHECPFCGWRDDLKDSWTTPTRSEQQPAQQWDPSRKLLTMFAQTVGAWLGNIVQKALWGGGGGAAKVSPPPPVPHGQEFRINPQYQAAADILQGERQAPQQAQSQLDDTLAAQTRFFGTGSVDPEAAGLTQADRAAPYRAETAMQQLRLSAGLGQRAAQSAELGHFEEASWLADQSGQALQGAWVEAAPGDLPLDQPDVAASEQVHAKYVAAVQAVQKRFDEAKAAERQWYEKHQEMEEAQRIVQNCEQTWQSVQEQIEARTGLGQSAEEQALDQAILAEALAAVRKAEENFQKVSDEAQERLENFNDLQQDAQDAAGKLNNTGLDANKLDQLLAEFSE